MQFLGNVLKSTTSTPDLSLAKDSLSGTLSVPMTREFEAPLNLAQRAAHCPIGPSLTEAIC